MQPFSTEEALQGEGSGKVLRTEECVLLCRHSFGWDERIPVDDGNVLKDKGVEGADMEFLERDVRIDRSFDESQGFLCEEGLDPGGLQGYDDAEDDGKKEYRHPA